VPTSKKVGIELALSKIMPIEKPKETQLV